MEKILILSHDLIFLLAGIFIVIYAASDRRANCFIRWIFIVALSVRILLMIGFEILSNLFSVWSFNDHETFIPIINGFYTFTYFLMLYGIIFLFGFSKNGVEPTPKPFIAKKRSVLLSLFLFIITIGVYFPFWLYRTVRDLKNNYNEIPYTPGQAVGYMFIPVFNIYWMFNIIISLPVKIRLIEKNHFGNDPGFQFHPVVIILLWIFLLTRSFLIQFGGEMEDSAASLIVLAVSTSLSIIVLALTIQAKMNSLIARSSEKEAEPQLP